MSGVFAGVSLVKAWAAVRFGRRFDLHALASDVSLEDPSLNPLDALLQAEAPFKSESVQPSVPYHLLALKSQSDCIDAIRAAPADTRGRDDAHFGPSLSVHDYLAVVIPYAIHRVRQWSLFTLPWNREHALTESERQELDVALEKHRLLEEAFQTHSRSRAGQYAFLADKFAFIEKALRELKRGINHVIKQGKVSVSQLSEVQSQLGRVEEVVRQLTENNKALRRMEAHKKRVDELSQQTGRRIATTLRYNAIQNQLRLEVRGVTERAFLPLDLDSEAPTRTATEALYDTNLLSKWQPLFWVKQNVSSDMRQMAVFREQKVTSTQGLYVQL